MKKILLIVIVQVIVALQGNTQTPTKVTNNIATQKVDTWDGKVQGRLMPNITATCKKCGKQVDIADMKGHPAKCGKATMDAGNTQLQAVAASEWVCHCCYNDEKTKGHKIPCPACKDNLGLANKIIATGFKDWTCQVCKKSFSELVDIERHIDKELGNSIASGRIITTGVSNDGYQCDCCLGVYTAEQLIAHAKICCKSNPSSAIANKIKGNCPPPCEWDTLVHEPSSSISGGPGEMLCSCCGKPYTPMGVDHRLCCRKADNPHSSIVILFPYTCNCCNKTIAFTGAAAAAAHSKECCPPPPTSTTGGTVTAGKLVTSGGNSYTCSWCNEPIAGGASGLSKHELDVHNMYAVRDGIYKGKKTFLNNEELKTLIQPLLPKDVIYQYAYIQKNKKTGAIDLVCYMCIRADGKLVYCNNSFSLPLIEEKGYLKITFNPPVIKTTKQPLVKQIKQNNYVGHLTLL